MNPELKNVLINGDLKRLKELVESGINIYQKDENENTPLLIAAAYGHIPIIEYLLNTENPKPNRFLSFLPSYLYNNKLASISERDKFGSTALLVAATNGQIPMFEYLLKNKLGDIAETNSSGYSAFLIAAFYGNISMLDYLITHSYANFLEKDYWHWENVLTLAAKNGHIEAVNFLLKKGAYIDMKSGDDRRPWEVIQDHSNKVALPMIKAADNLLYNYNLVSLYYLNLGTEQKNELESILITLGDSLNARRCSDGNTALHLAIKNKNNEFILKLLEAGADIFIPNSNGETASSLLEGCLKENKEKYQRHVNVPSIPMRNMRDGGAYILELQTLKEAHNMLLHIEPLLLFAKLRAYPDKEKKEMELLKLKLKLKFDLMQSIESLDPISQSSICLKLLEMCSKIQSSQYDPKFVTTLKKILLENLQKLKNNVQEKICLRLYNLTSNPNSPIFDEHISQMLFPLLQTIHHGFNHNYHTLEEIEDSLVNIFNETQAIFSICDKTKHKFTCSVRVPPITKHFSFVLTSSNEYLVNDVFIGNDERTVTGTFNSLESLGLFFVTQLQAIVNKKKQEIRGDFDPELKVQAADRESAVRDLSKRQKGILEAVRKQYDEKLYFMGGESAVLRSFKEYLKEMFLKNPPEFNGQKLPFKAALRLDTLQEIKELKEIQEHYYTNPFHTAWRFLSKPNLIDQGHKLNIAYLWLAASDSSITPIRGMTLETMKEQFAEEIAYIQRAHNWDALNQMAEGKEKKEIMESMIKKWGRIVDDLQPDKPSCTSGVTQRLMQSINGNPITEIPEFKPLDANIVRTHIAELITTKFNQYIEQKNAKEIQKLLDAFMKKYVIMSKISSKESKLLEEFKLSSKDIKELIAKMLTQYGDRFNYIELRVDSERYFCSEEYARKLLSSDLWEQSFNERMRTIALARLEKLQGEQAKELKEGKDSKDSPDSLEMKDSKEKMETGEDMDTLLYRFKNKRKGESQNPLNKEKTKKSRVSKV